MISGCMQVATMFLFLYSDLGLGTVPCLGTSFQMFILHFPLLPFLEMHVDFQVINIVFQAESERVTIGPAFSFSAS